MPSSSDPRSRIRSRNAHGFPRPQEPLPRSPPFRDHRLRSGVRGDPGARAGGIVHGPSRQEHGDHRELQRGHLGDVARDAERGLRPHLPGDQRAAGARRARGGARRQPDRAVHEHPAPHRGRGRQPRLRPRGLLGLEPALEGGGRCGGGSPPRQLHHDGRVRGTPLRRIRDRRIPRDARPALQDHRPHPGCGVLHHHPDRVHGLPDGPGAAPDPAGQGPVHPGEARAPEPTGAP